ncbi:IS3 family transposase [Chryseobacterium sp. SG20098]|uniref:IS3 family transposase n=1 Tax=Chryseobacterium sp. SG20098 TaxID=3074145 RepID=UPI00288310EE|nr:IS3 family transposase [Chryseobacterium sp. SG20098]WNI34754.1 IS3 family transposase [Chryseobacterium sp. SG20098]WNI37698.1 IS3 family transposase [Chryseobacterium sp. SG20098]WNI38742.1 IS3 family transposase [Chryseobacterium sp. SG20098]
MDRQVYYRNVKRKNSRRQMAQDIVFWVEQLRMIHPKMGGKKLYFLLRNKLENLRIGRDKFFDILRANHLLVIPKRSYHKTTNSYHRFKKHKNLIKEYSIQKPNEVWVSDITYLGNRENPSYLSLITDAYSRKIVGYDVSDSLATESALRALKTALRKEKPTKLIHHSDRGLQYCSNDYQKILNKSKILCSMTQESDPYENAIAERVNGILKQEYDIDKFNVDLNTQKILVEQVVKIYNELRPHLSNHYLTPTQMHQQQVLIPKSYKKKSSANKSICTAQ